MSKLVIVESPTKVKTIKKYLGSDYKVMASMGHIRDLPKSKLGLNRENNYEPEYISIRGKTELIHDLKKEAKNADKVLLATDPDREGEAISWHLATILGLNLSAENRVTFNEITKKGILEGMKSPRKINMDLVDAQQARRVLDRLVGYGISPILWSRIRKHLSAGRVQSVATRLIVDRENEVNAFVPEEYWKIAALLRQEGKKSSFVARYVGTNGKKESITCEKDALSLKSVLTQANYSVSDVVTAKKEKAPMPPFTTSTLQQEASRLLNMTSKRTMQVAQTLYEGVEIPGHGQTGLITYMRTDSLRLSDEAVAAAREYIKAKFGSEFCPKTARHYKARSGAQDAHEAIRPASTQFDPESIKDSLSKDEYRLYRLIWDRFIACQMASQVYNATTVSIDAVEGNNKHNFKANGTTVLFMGYTAVYQEFHEKDEDDDNKLPLLSKNEIVELKEITAEQKFTQPPSRYTEAALIKALEENGIGRPSTYAPTISTILQREYVERDGKVFKPTNLGIATTNYMCDKFPDIVDTEFTAKMENNLDKVGDGKANWVNVIRSFDKNLQKSIDEAKKDDSRVNVPSEESDEICDRCGAKMVIKSGKFGKFLACPNYPNCTCTKPILHKTGAACPKCGGTILQKTSKRGTKYYSCEHSPQCDFMSWYEPTDKMCEVCGKVLLKKYGFKGATLICSNDKCPTREGENK